jgi:hypothetical protein
LNKQWNLISFIYFWLCYKYTYLIQQTLDLPCGLCVGRARKIGTHDPSAKTLCRVKNRHGEAATRSILGRSIGSLLCVYTYIHHLCMYVCMKTRWAAKNDTEKKPVPSYAKFGKCWYGPCLEKNWSKVERACERKSRRDVAGWRNPRRQWAPYMFEIRKLQNDYGLTMIRNVDNLEAMKRGLWARFFLPNLSTDGSQQHGLFLGDTDTWCKFKNSTSSEIAYEYKHSLSAAVMDAKTTVSRPCHWRSSEEISSRENSEL